MLALAREALLSETVAPAWTVRCIVVPGMSYTGGDAMQALRRGFRARGAAWLRQELANKTVAQLRELAGAAGAGQGSGASTRNRERSFCTLCRSAFPSRRRCGESLSFCPVHPVLQG